MSCIFNFLLRHRSIALFRAVQESLSNIIRHAQATHLRITIRTEAEMLHVTIADNGVGMESGSPRSLTSFGLAGAKNALMRSAGALTWIAP